MPTALNQALIDQAAEIATFTASRSTSSQTEEVPVRFTYVVGPQSSFTADLDFALNLLNQAFAPAGLHFFQCAPVNEVWDDRIKASEDIDNFISSFSYTSSAMEVYLKPGSLPAILSQAAIPCPSYLEGNPNFPSCNTIQNWMKITGPGDLGKTFIHETGHHFGLLHTFHAGTNYHLPVDPTQLDRPTAVLDGNNQIVPGWWGRELVIHSPDQSKDFKQPNFNAAGDLLEDTPADCNWKFPSIWPGCLYEAQSTSTCDFDLNLLTYKDYNSDPLLPTPANYSLGRNYMSYWHPECLNQFTPKQLERIIYYNETFHKPKYANSRCGTFTDNVQFWGTSTGLHNVTVRVRHPDDARICNVTSSRLGNFGGTLYTDNVQVTAYHNGKKNELMYPNDPLRMHYKHTHCEWARGINTDDIMAISKHILGAILFTSGYARIAADANKDGSITTTDIQELRKLILGIYSEGLPAYDQPWRYMPEFIPQDFTTSFNTDPFHMNLGSGNIGTAYLEPQFQFSTASLPLDKRGFDGVKIGDVNGSWPTTTDLPCANEGIPNEPGILLTVPATSLTQDQNVKLTFKVKNFQTVEAFQLGIAIPYDKFEVLDVITGTLTGYTKEDYFGLTQLNASELRTLWYSSTGGSQTLSDNTSLFSLIVKAKQPVSSLKSELKLDEGILHNAFWQNNGVDAQTITLEVAIESAGERSDQLQETSIESDAVLQVLPNPFNSTLQMTFINPSTVGEGVVSISNTQGQIVYRQNVTLVKGENNWSVEDAKKFPTGLYLVKLTTLGHIYSSKLVKQ